MSHLTWRQTYTGRRFDLVEPTADMVCLEDIAHALSLTNRFGGHVTRAYSVAEHSLYVSWVDTWRRPHTLAEPSPLLALYSLLHDAHEAYLGDLHPGIKPICGQFKALCERIDHAIWAHFEIPPPSPSEYAIVKSHENLVFLAEVLVLFNKGRRHDFFVTNPEAERLMARYITGDLDVRPIVDHIAARISEARDTTAQEWENKFYWSGRLMLGR